MSVVRPPLKAQLIVVGVVLLQLALGVRGLVTDDNRFGWGMFREVVGIRIQVFWVEAGGRQRPVDFSGYRAPRRVLPGKRLGYYSPGVTRAELRTLAETLAARAPEGARAVRCIVQFDVNLTGRPGPPEIIECAVGR